MIRRGLAVVLCSLSFALHAETLPSDAMGWLARIATAGQNMNYAGTFTYQNGQRMETSRITHLRDASGEYERLETLDGSPREVVRINNEVRCALPSQKTLIIDQAARRRGFPSRLALVGAQVSESYTLRLGELGRVAGMEAQQLVLEPKDDLRHGLVLWADRASGLLLKSRMLDETGNVVEQFSFTDVRVGIELTQDQLRSRYGDQSGWKVVNTRGNELRKEELSWALRATPPGFSLSSLVKRTMGRGRAEAVHLVYSDGLAAVSIFIEPLAEMAGAQSGSFNSGPINIYKRVLGDHLVTALGEVPARTVQRLAESVEPR